MFHQSAVTTHTFDFHLLKPYASFLILEVIGDVGVASHTAQRLVAQTAVAESRGKRRESLTTSVVDGTFAEGRTPYVHELWISHCLGSPSWVAPGAELEDKVHEMAIVTQFRGFIAVAGSQRLRKAVRDQVRRGLYPTLRCLEQAKLMVIFDQAAMVVLTTKNASSSKRNLRARTRYAGDVRSTLSPLRVGSSVLNSAKSLTETLKDIVPALFGKSVHWSPKRSSASFAACSDWQTFNDRVLTLLDTIADDAPAAANHLSTMPISLPILSLDDVAPACEIFFTHPDHLLGDIDEERLDAAEALSQCRMGRVHSHPSGVGFDFEIGPDGSLAGWMTCSIRFDHGDLRVRFRPLAQSEPSDDQGLRKVSLDDVPMQDRDTNGDLYEYMLSKIASAGQNGQHSRFPGRRIGLLAGYSSQRDDRRRAAETLPPIDVPRLRLRLDDCCGSAA